MRNDRNFKVLPKVAALLMNLVILSLLAGCKVNTDSVIEEAKRKDVPLVVSTIFPGYDFAKEVAKDKAVVYQLLKPGAESHTYEPTPQDMILIRDCDIFIYAGGESDTWLSDILEDNSNPDRIIISMMDEVNAVEEEEKEGMREGGVLAEYLGEEEEEEFDEHVWTSPLNAAKISEKICESLCALNPSAEELYRDNCEDYLGRLSALNEKYKKVREEAKRNVIVVADRFPFRYLCDEYNLDYCAAYPGCSEDAEVTADTVITLCDVVNKQQIPVVFSIEFSGGKIANSVCECTNAKRLTLHSAHNVSYEDIKRGVSYISIMEDNLSALQEALY